MPVGDQLPTPLFPLPVPRHWQGRTRKPYCVEEIVSVTLHPILLTVSSSPGRSLVTIAWPAVHWCHPVAFAGGGHPHPVNFRPGYSRAGMSSPGLAPLARALRNHVGVPHDDVAGRQRISPFFGGAPVRDQSPSRNFPRVLAVRYKRMRPSRPCRLGERHLGRAGHRADVSWSTAACPPWSTSNTTQAQACRQHADMPLVGKHSVERRGVFRATGSSFQTRPWGRYPSSCCKAPCERRARAAPLGPLVRGMRSCRPLRAGGPARATGPGFLVCVCPAGRVAGEPSGLQQSMNTASNAPGVNPSLRHPGTPSCSNACRRLAQTGDVSHWPQACTGGRGLVFVWGITKVPR